MSELNFELPADVLDPAVLDVLPTTADLPGKREASPPGTRLGSEAIIELREEHLTELINDAPGGRD